MRSRVLIPFAIALVVSACGRGASSPHPAPSSAASTLPAAVGPVLTFDDGYPYTVQGVRASVTPTAYGTPAPANWTWVSVAIEVKATLSDRPTPAPNPRLTLTWPDCDQSLADIPTECITSGNLERGIRYMTRQQVDARQQPQWPHRSEVIQPGVAYITVMSMKVPQAVPLDRIKMCTIVPLGKVQQCVLIGRLPRTTD